MSKQVSASATRETSKLLEYNNFFEWELSTKELAGAGVLRYALHNVDLPATTTAEERWSWKEDREE